MSCTHPYTAFDTGIKTDSGKTEFFLSREHSTFIPAWQVSKRFGVPYFRDLTDYIEVPCGKCFECRKEKSRKWGFRCLFEAMDHKENYFVTLTYAYIPPVLEWKKDLQKFFKRLRRIGYKFRYFACGEKGELNKRPHFHVLFFGLHLDELIPWSGSGATKLYRSPMLERLWPYGFVGVGIAMPAACGQYIAKYTLKSEPGQGFVTMSRKPGIGFDHMLRVIQEENKLSAGWSLLSIGDGRGNLMQGSLPRSLREKLCLSADDEITRACILKTQNKMRACGYTDADIYNFAKVTEFRESQEYIDKKREVFGNLSKD